MWWIGKRASILWQYFVLMGSRIWLEETNKTWLVGLRVGIRIHVLPKKKNQLQPPRHRRLVAVSATNHREQKLSWEITTWEKWRLDARALSLFDFARLRLVADLPTFRDSVCTICLIFADGNDMLSETSAVNYKCRPPNISQEQKPQITTFWTTQEVMCILFKPKVHCPQAVSVRYPFTLSSNVGYLQMIRSSVPIRTKSILLSRASRLVLEPSGSSGFRSVFLGCGVSFLGAGAPRYDMARWSNYQRSKCSLIGSLVQKWQHENEHLNSVTMWSAWGSGRLSTRTPRLCVSWCRTRQGVAPRPTSLCSSGCACCTFRVVRPHWSTYVCTYCLFNPTFSVYWFFRPCVLSDRHSRRR